MSLYYDFESFPLDMPLHTGYNVWEVCHIVSGTGWLTTDETQMRLSSGEVILIPPHLPHEFRFDQTPNPDEKNEIGYIFISFQDQVLDKYTTILPKLKEKFDLLRQLNSITRFTPESSRLITRLMWKMKDLKDEERVSALLKLTLLLTKENGELNTGQSPKDVKTQKTLELINLYIMHNANRKFKLEDIASHVNMSRFAFCSFFRKYTGKTFFSYLEEYRIRLACKLLEGGNTTISDVCYKSGFNDIPYFNRTFKRIMGVSPKEYRALK